jgi:hypothetical protein
MAINHSIVLYSPMTRHRRSQVQSYEHTSLYRKVVGISTAMITHTDPSPVYATQYRAMPARQPSQSSQGPRYCTQPVFDPRVIQVNSPTPRRSSSSKSVQNKKKSTVDGRRSNLVETLPRRPVHTSHQTSCAFRSCHVVRTRWR